MNIKALLIAAVIVVIAYFLLKYLPIIALGAIVYIVYRIVKAIRTKPSTSVNNRE